MSMMAPSTSDTLSLKDLLRVSYESKASDLHINASTEPLMRLHGKLMKVVDSVLSPEDTHRMAKEILTKEQYETLSKKGEVDFSFELPGLSRYRGNVFKQKRCINMVFRVLSTTVPSLFSLNLPDLVQEFAHKHQGLVLVTGPTGSGKSTTLGLHH